MGERMGYYEGDEGDKNIWEELIRKIEEIHYDYKSDETMWREFIDSLHERLYPYDLLFQYYDEIQDVLLNVLKAQLAQYPDEPEYAFSEYMRIYQELIEVISEGDEKKFKKFLKQLNKKI